ncbi:hypothetical protein BDY17DRAFT_320330 [Neohortaea acidophila]|uniref:Tic20-like protein n=1 Tax=Neohortaea acidophila TaxID=245834 RepID=A0A6A6Q774_9PEZI|nr:uncharacterized protein BDY17DRAFT_320330 [Neohortaea acidophila]KAF2487816.1 hypothetical protein BDY17DRAFT_320330 [Neohortaea acidophila]
MAMNFAPYQSSPPESERAKSPPLRSPTTSPAPPLSPHPQRNLKTPILPSSRGGGEEDPWAAARNARLPSPSQFADETTGGYTDLESGEAAAADRYANDYIGHGAWRHSATAGVDGAGFETSLGFPLRLEACLAYLLLPPAGGVVLLLFEHKSDYVRFHAWQSAMLFSAVFLLHVVFSWTAVVSWMLFVGDLGLIVYLTACAWRNAGTLDRVEVPFFGRLASSFVDDE